MFNTCDLEMNTMGSKLKVDTNFYQTGNAKGQKLLTRKIRIFSSRHKITLHISHTKLRYQQSMAFNYIHTVRHFMY